MDKWMHEYYNEKRRKDDFWNKSIKWLNVFGWCILFISLFFLEMAKPGPNAFDTSKQSVQLLQVWDMNYINIMTMLLSFSFLLSLIAIFINTKRHNRESDIYRVSLFILAAINLLGILYFKFGL